MLNNDTEISIPNPNNTIKPIGPGARLRKIREARHLTSDDMAKRIRLGRERLIQLENDDYQSMGAPAFAKGYLRSYASQLGISKEDILEILRAFDELSLGEDIQHNKPELLNEKMGQVNPKAARWVSYLIFIALLLGVLGYVWRNHANVGTAANTDKSATETVETPAPVLPESTTIQPLTTPPAVPKQGKSVSLSPSASMTQPTPPDTQVSGMNDATSTPQTNTTPTTSELKRLPHRIATNLEE
jgi:cytoskeleton protein RodZ